MVLKGQRLAMPLNPEYSIPQLKMMLSEVSGFLGREISVEEWNEL